MPRWGDFYPAKSYYCRKMRTLLPLLLCLLPAPVFAGNELFDPTSLAVRFNFGHHGNGLADISTEKLAAISPAAGDEHAAAAHDAEPAPAPKPNSLADEAKAALAAEQQKASEAASKLDSDIAPGDPLKPAVTEHPTDGKADGEAEAGGHGGVKKSASGKPLSKPPELPKVMIGGQVVVTNMDQIARDISASTPPGLKDAESQSFLEQRMHITTYAHAPVRGSTSPTVQVIEFVDLSCGQCMQELSSADAAITDYISTTQIVHVHAPTLKFQDTNLPAFYGKVAARAGTFWAYRDSLVSNKPADDAAVFDTLVKSGVSARDARSLMLNEARRFYREMDADALLARAFNVTKPPVLFVNGIRVGDGGIPLSKLPDVMQYVTNRFARGLPEPPQ